MIVLSAEDGAADTIVPRLMAAGADRSRIEIIEATIVKDEAARSECELSAWLRT